MHAANVRARVTEHRMIELPQLLGPALYGADKRSWSVMVRRIGCLVSGDLRRPLLDADTVCARDGKFTFIGALADAPDPDFDVVIDANHATVFPGLIDSHIHPTLGEYSPRADH